MLYLKHNYCFFIKKRVFFEGTWASGGGGGGAGGGDGKSPRPTTLKLLMILK